MGCKHEDGVKITHEMPCPFCRVEELEQQRQTFLEAVTKLTEERDTLRSQLQATIKQADTHEYNLGIAHGSLYKVAHAAGVDTGKYITADGYDDIISNIADEVIEQLQEGKL